MGVPIKFSATTFTEADTNKTVYDIATFGTQEGCEIAVWVFGWTDGEGTPKYLSACSLASFGALTQVNLKFDANSLGCVQLFRASLGSYTGSGQLAFTWQGHGDAVGYVSIARNAEFKAGFVQNFSSEISFTSTTSFDARGGTIAAAAIKKTSYSPTAYNLDSHASLTLSPYWRGRIARRAGFPNLEEDFGFTWSSSSGYQDGTLAYIYYDPLHKTNMPRIL